MVVSEFNARAISAYCEYLNIMGHYRKGEVEHNGQEIFNLCLRNDLCLMILTLDTS